MNWERVRDGLLSVHDLFVEHPEKWTRGTFFRDADGNEVDRASEAETYCVLGACYREFGIDEPGEEPGSSELEEAMEVLNGCALTLFGEGPAHFVNDEIGSRGIDLVDDVKIAPGEGADIAPVLAMVDCAVFQADQRTRR